MITNSLNLHNKFNNFASKQQNIAFCSNLDDRETEKRMSFSPYTAQEAMVKKNRQGKPFSLEKDLCLGKKLAEGKAIRDIYAVYSPQNSEKVRKISDDYNKAKAFIIDICPEQADKIFKMVEENSSRKTIYKAVKDLNLLQNEKSINHPYREDLKNSYNEKNRKNPLLVVVDSLRDGQKTQDLIKRINQDQAEGKISEKQISQIKSGIMPTEFKKKIKEAEQAATELKNNYSYLVMRIASKYGYVMELADAIGSGGIGLSRAVERYDYQKNTPFENFAATSISRKIIISLKDNAFLIKIPRDLYSNLFKYKNAKERPDENDDAQTSIEKVLNKTGFTLEQQTDYEKLLKTAAPASFSFPVGDGDKNSLGDFITYADADSSEKKSIDTDSRNKLNSLIEKLIPDEKARLILQQRIIHKEKLNKIGEMLNPPVSRERVRQVVKTAIIDARSKVREYMELQKISEEEKQALSNKMKAVLTPEEEQIIKLMNGCDSPDGEKSTYDKVSKIVGGNLTTVRSKYLKGMDKLKVNGITENDVCKLKKMPLIGELVSVYSEYIGKDAPYPKDEDDYLSD